MFQIGYYIKGSGEKAYGLYEVNLLAFVLSKFDFWSSKCPNYENIEFQTLHNNIHYNFLLNMHFIQKTEIKLINTKYFHL